MNPCSSALGNCWERSKYFTPVIENNTCCFPKVLWDFREYLCTGGAEVEEVIPVIPWNAADCVAAKL